MARLTFDGGGVEDAGVDGTIPGVDVNGEANDAHGSKQQCVAEGSLFHVRKLFSVPAAHSLLLSLRCDPLLPPSGDNRIAEKLKAASFGPMVLSMAARHIYQTW